MSDEEWGRFQTQYSLYASGGFFSVLGNGFILLTILRKKEIRKKHALLLLLAAADLNLGLGYATAAFRRLAVVARGEHKVRSPTVLFHLFDFITGLPYKPWRGSTC